MKAQLYDLIESHEYDANDLYMTNISETLEERFNIVKVTKKQLYALTPGALDYGMQKNNVLCRLKLRTLYNDIDRIAPLLKNTNLIVNDFDTTENFMPDSPYFGSYQKIMEKLPNIRRWLVQSWWWSEQVRMAGMPCVAAKQWINPKYCCQPIPWKDRQRDVVFSGSMHGHRKVFFEELQKAGLKVEVRQRTPGFIDYLNYLSNSRVMVRSERRNQVVRLPGTRFFYDMELPMPNTLWQRDVECAGRGCFSLREPDEEMYNWRVHDVPSIVTFETIEECVRLVKTILNNPSVETLVEEGIEVVKFDGGHTSVADLVASFIE